MEYKRFFKIFTIIHFSLLMTLFLLLFVYHHPLLSALAMCPTRLFFHIYCPFCGGTRALILLLHGRFITSFLTNPVTLVLAAVCLYYEACAVRSLYTHDLRYIRGARLRVLFIPLAVAVIWFFLHNILAAAGIWDPLTSL